MRRLKAPLVLTTVSLACGGLASNDELPGSAGGAGGGRSSGGSGGSVGAPSCPAKVPVGNTACQGPIECTYTLECASGQLDVTYTCVDGAWSEQGPCQFELDHCTDTRLSCVGGTWVDYGGYGGNPPPPCPPVKPPIGEKCSFSLFTGPPFCGYRCDSGDWTKGDCGYSSIWLFDGACAGDCSGADKAIAGYVVEHSTCTTDADCTVLKAPCSILTNGKGAYYANRTIDPARVAELEAALTACATAPGSSWQCLTPTVEPPPAQCSPSGTCGPGG